MTDIERIDQLREELHVHNYNYYVLNAPVISDLEFDKLMRETAKIWKHYTLNTTILIHLVFV